MSYLADRALALEVKKFDKVREIQDKMTQYKNEHLDELTTPKMFYCTFHHEYAYHKALELAVREDKESL